MSFPHTSELGLDPISDRLERTAHEEARPIPGIVVYRFEVPLAYANAQAFSDGDRSLVEVADPPARVLVVDCELMYDVDYTGTEALEGLVEEMREVGVEVRLTRVHPSWSSAPTHFTSRSQREGVRLSGHPLCRFS